MVDEKALIYLSFVKSFETFICCVCFTEERGIKYVSTSTLRTRSRYSTRVGSREVTREWSKQVRLSPQSQDWGVSLSSKLRVRVRMPVPQLRGRLWLR